ncbi:MAG: class I SAM-dependent methyltransferase [Mariprofundaceae bacterium]|nr:class I SAM-dependent methyltransferase [Mariprofundaceae bacterium]
MTQTAVFDPLKYKETTRQQWNTAAEAWHRWGPFLNRWLGSATETMFDMTDIKPGSRVLDVAAGAGEQSLAAACRVGEGGYVLATDLSADILNYAKSSAQLAGHNNVDTQVVDGEALNTLQTEPFDAVISRVGLIYFPDQQKALTGMHKQLKEGGKVGAMVYATADKNPFFSIPVGIIRRRAQLPPPLLGQPGPFSLGDPLVLEKSLLDAGFKDVEVATIDAPLRMESALECLQFEQESFGALHQMLGSLSAIEQDDAWREIETALLQFESDGKFTGPCKMLVASGTK